MTRARDKSRALSPSPSPPPPPSKQQAAVDNAGLVVDGVVGAGAGKRVGTDEGVRRRKIRGEKNGDAFVANGRHALAVHANGNGTGIARKEL